MQSRLVRRFKDRQAWTYTPPGGSPVEIEVIWRDAVSRPNPADTLEIVSTEPTIHLKASDLPETPKERSGIFTRVETGETYEVSRVEPDGEGMLTIFLHK